MNRHKNGRPLGKRTTLACGKAFNIGRLSELLGSAHSPVVVLRAALTSSTSHIAVDLLKENAEHRPELVRQLVPDLFFQALGVSPVCAKARRGLSVLATQELDLALPPLIADFYADPTIGWEYRGLAMLLDQLGLRAVAA